MPQLYSRLDSQAGGLVRGTARSVASKKSSNAIKLKSNALKKSKARATTKGRYDEYRVLQHPGSKETIDYKTGRTNKKPKVGMPVSKGVFSFPKEKAGRNSSNARIKKISKIENNPAKYQTTSSKYLTQARKRQLKKKAK